MGNNRKTLLSIVENQILSYEEELLICSLSHRNDLLAKISLLKLLQTNLKTSQCPLIKD